MSFVIHHSTEKSLQKAVSDIRDRFENNDLGLVVFFASSQYDGAKLADQMQRSFREVPTIGCTTAGEIVSGHMLKQSIVAMGFPKGALQGCSIQVVQDLSKPAAIHKAFDGFKSRFKTPPQNLPVSDYLGLVVIDGLSLAEELVNDTIGNLTNVPFVGGSAGDDLAFKQTHVFAMGEAYTKSAVLALLKPTKKAYVLKTQSFVQTGKVLTATKVDEAKRIIVEFDHKPAAEAYARALGATVDQVANCFMRNPVGLMVDDEAFVRSPQRLEGSSVVFYCAVKEGMQLQVLESTDIVEGTRKALRERIQQVGKASAIINFHCILRTLELENQKQTQAYADLFREIPTIGFSTYGESYIGHINQTSTMVLFE